MAENMALTEAKQTFSMALTERLDSVALALPKDFNKARFVQNALALLNDNQDLAKYGQTQIIGGLLKGAYLGLDFYSKEAYLIPYGKSLNFQTDYRGEKKLIKKYAIRPVRDIYAKVVREGDEFNIEIKNSKTVVNFSPKPFNTGAIIGAFAVCEYQDGGISADMMSLEELENTRKHSKAANSMAWKDFTSEMYKKTVLRRLCKQIEIDFETPVQQATYNEEMAIETDPMEVAAREIEANANAEEITFEDIE